MDEPTVGVLVLSYGTPRGLDEVETYYTDIRRGRPPTPEQLADLIRRYESIGGVSPLRERTEAQRIGLQSALDTRSPGRFRTALGFKHASPSIEAAVDELVGAGATSLVGLVLAPHYSALSVGEYLERAAARAAEHTVAMAGITSWHMDRAYLDFQAGSVRRALDGMPARTVVLFSAHSLPARIATTGDPYPSQLEATAAAVGASLGLERGEGWLTAWQSAGRTPEPWLGPDLTEVIRSLASSGSVEGVVVNPCGFVADHLEVLHDVDIEARQVATDAGLAFARAEVVNDDPGVLAGLADLVVATAPSEAGS